MEEALEEEKSFGGQSIGLAELSIDFFELSLLLVNSEWVKIGKLNFIQNEVKVQETLTDKQNASQDICIE